MVRAIVGVALFSGAAVLEAQVTLMGTTATQAVVRYTASSDAPCQLLVTEHNSTTSVADTDATLFAGADSDNRPGNVSLGRSRLVVLGKRSAEKASTGLYVSRALQANTLHNLTVTCDGAAQMLSFSTVNPPAGELYPELPGTASDTYGRYAWPQWGWGNRQQTMIDPMTGIQLKRGTAPGDYGSILNNVPFAVAWDANGAWTNAAAAVSQTDWASTSSSSPLFLAAGEIDLDYIATGGLGPYQWSIDNIREELQGYGVDLDPANRTLNVCLTLDSGQTCVGNVLTLVAPAPGGSTSIPSPNLPFPGAPFERWGGSVIPHQLIAPSSGSVSISGNTVQLTSSSIASYFNLDWPVNSKIFLANTAPACAQNLCTIASVVSTSELQLVEQPTVTTTTYRAANFGLRISKTTTVGTVFIRGAFDVAGSKMFGQAINGTGDFCSSQSDLTSVAADGTPLSQPLSGHLCILPATSGFAVLYFFIPSSGELRPLSVLLRAYDADPLDGGGSLFLASLNSFDPTDPRVIYALNDTGNGPYYRSLFRGRYTGDYRSFPSYTISPNDQIVWTNLTPKSKNRDLASQVAAQRSDYNPSIFSSLSGVGVLGQNYIFTVSPGQDHPCMVGLVDLNTGDVTVKDSWSQYPGRWGTCHSIQTLGSAEWMVAAINPARYPSDGSPLNGPWRTQVAAVFKGGQWSLDTSLPGSTIDTCPANLSTVWQSLGATGKNCIRVLVTGEPCSASPSDLEKTLYPCPHDATQSMLQPLAEGDILADLTIDVLHERFRVVSKTVRSPQAIELVLQRKAQCADVVPPSFFDHAAGWGLNPVSTGGCYAATWWLNLQNKPFNWLVDNSALVGSHNDIGPSPTPGRYTFLSGPNQIRFDRSFLSQLGQSYSDAGTTAPAFASSTASLTTVGYTETYPSYRQWLAPAPEKRWALDFRAYQAGLGVTPEEPLTLFANSLTLVPGQNQVYQISNPKSGFDRKNVPYLAWAGRNLLRDISGPAAVITDSDVYTFCVADKAGECVPGSAAQTAYVNVPQANNGNGAPHCVTNNLSDHYPCFLTANPVGGWALQWDLSRLDKNGGTLRRLTMGLDGPGREYTFSNAHPSPEGNWAWIPGYWMDGYRTDLMLAKLPPWPARSSLNRAAFLPIRHTVPAMDGATQARVRFGYAENGPVESFYCTSRQESCVAQTAVTLSSPFAWLSEQNLVPCASGCTVELPAISGRVLYYQVERLDALGTVVATGPMEALAIH